MPDDLVSTVDAVLQREPLLPAGESCLVAVSGGLDSMVLFHVLCRLQAQYDWKLVVAHFDHQLRGDVSEADAAFVARTARQANLPFELGQADVASLADSSGMSVEMAARECRHRFFAETAIRLNASRVVLAHHGDDQVELFFLRLFRGAGSAGLGGMAHSQPSPFEPRVQLVRPLLELSKQDLQRYAEAENIDFREDASNASTDILRNRVRHELLPMLADGFTPAIAEQVRRSMTLLSAEHAALEAQVKSWLSNDGSEAALGGAGEGEDVDGFPALPVAWQREALRLELLRLGVRPEFSLIEELRCAPVGWWGNVDGGRQVSRSANAKLSFRPETVVSFESDEREVRVNSHDVTVVEFRGMHLSFEIASSDAARSAEGHDLATEFFDAELVGEAVVLRHWRPGDRFHPIGMKGTVKLQDWFTNLKIDPAQRRRLLVAEASSGELFWVEGQRISETFKVRPTSQRLLRLRWERRSQK